MVDSAAYLAREKLIKFPLTVASAGECINYSHNFVRDHKDPKIETCYTAAGEISKI